MMFVRKYGAALAALLFAAAALAGCGSSSDGGGDEDTPAPAEGGTVTGVSIAAEGGTASVAAEGSLALTAQATVTGSPALTYAWTLAPEGSGHAALSATAGDRATLTGTNRTAQQQTVFVTVQASDGTRTVTSEPLTVTVGAHGTLTALAVATQPDVTRYAVGGTFSAAGLTLTATYSGGDTKTLSATDAGVQLSTPDMATEGTKTVTVTYTDGDFGSAQTSFGITVQNPAATFAFELLGGSDLAVDYDAATHTFTATPPDAGASYTYTWYIDEAKKTEGSAAMYTIASDDITALADGNPHQLLLTAADASDSNLTYTAHCTITVQQ